MLMSHKQKSLPSAFRFLHETEDGGGRKDGGGKRALLSLLTHPKIGTEAEFQFVCAASRSVCQLGYSKMKKQIFSQLL